MKVIIAGSRTITNYSELYAAIAESLFEIDEVVCGGAAGVDSIGRDWAMESGIPVRTFQAKWVEHGKVAGPIRNQQMAEYADALILIWDGKSKGSSDMLQRAARRGLKIHQRIVT